MVTYRVRTTTYPGAYTPTSLPSEVAPTEEPEIPCCIRADGLCEWVEPECEFLDEEDRKSLVWDDKICNEIHPDDMDEIRKRYMLYKLQQKMIDYARVSGHLYINITL